MSNFTEDDLIGWVNAIADSGKEKQLRRARRAEGLATRQVIVNIAKYVAECNGETYEECKPGRKICILEQSEQMYETYTEVCEALSIHIGI